MPPDPIARFIRACLCSRWSPDKVGEAGALVGAGLDWDAVQRSADERRLSGVLFSETRNTNLIPKHVQHQLGLRYRAVAERNLYLLSVLDEVLSATTRRGISVTVLKGLDLIQHVYDSIGDRSVADVDILVSERDVPIVLDCLVGLGFEIPYAHTTATALSGITAGRSKPAYVEVDVHWYFVRTAYHRTRVGMPAVFDRCLPFEGSLLPALRLAPEDQFLHLATHWVSHTGLSVIPGDRWDYDLARVRHAFQDSWDWNLLFDLARQYDLIWTLKQALETTEDYWLLPRLEAMGESLANLAPSKAEREAYARLEDESWDVYTWLDAIRHAETGGKSIRILGGALFPPPRRLRPPGKPVHWWILPILYVRHLAMGAGRLLRALHRRLRGPRPA